MGILAVLTCFPGLSAASVVEIAPDVFKVSITEDGYLMNSHNALGGLMANKWYFDKEIVKVMNNADSGSAMMGFVDTWGFFKYDIEGLRALGRTAADISSAQAFFYLSGFNDMVNPCPEGTAGELSVTAYDRYDENGNEFVMDKNIAGEKNKAVLTGETVRQNVAGGFDKWVNVDVTDIVKYWLEVDGSGNYVNFNNGIEAYETKTGDNDQYGFAIGSVHETDEYGRLENTNFETSSYIVVTTPLPGAAVMLGSGFFGLLGVRKKNRN